MVFGVNGNNHINPPTFKQGLVKTAKTDVKQPIDMTVKSESGNQIGRTDLDNLNKIDPKTIELQNLTDASNAILASIGSKIKVTPTQVASVDGFLTQQVLPALTDAGNAATEARIANPNGPFADLFSAIA